jgi:hypothetical protein
MNNNIFSNTPMQTFVKQSNFIPQENKETPPLPSQPVQIPQAELPTKCTCDNCKENIIFLYNDHPKIMKMFITLFFIIIIISSVLNIVKMYIKNTIYDILHKKN